MSRTRHHAIVIVMELPLFLYALIRLVVFRFTVPVENPDIGIPAKGNRRCLRFQTPDLQLQIQDEDLT